jgi:hypothetical protein
LTFPSHDRNAHRGDELFAGSEGNNFNFPAVGGAGDHVGPGSYTTIDPTGGSDEGAGQRQSIWAFEFDTTENLKIQLDSDFVNSLTDYSTIYINVHYLDDNATGVFNVNVFDQTEETGVTLANTGNWVINTTTVSGFTVDTDSDGAHVFIDITSGTVKFHMIEVSKV